MITKTSTAPRQPLAGPRISGMNCPICQNFIPISISQLLYDGGIMCPHCGLRMTINQSLSRRALDALRKVENATRRVKETETFKR